jgi:hypothetical protein
MVTCRVCQTKNDDNAFYCTHCGASLRGSTASTIERHTKKFAEEMERVGKDVGKTMEQAAKKIHDDVHDKRHHIEHRIDHASRYRESRYDKTYGPVGPLLSSLIFLIIIRFVILILQSIQASADELQVLQAIAAVLLIYLFPLFLVNLLSNYTKYFSRKYHQFRLVSPLFHTIAFVITLWLLMEILADLAVRLTIPGLLTAATSVEQLLPTIFVFVLLLSYVVLVVTKPWFPEKQS